MDLFVVIVMMILGVLFVGVEIALIPGVGFAGLAGLTAFVGAIAYSFMFISPLAGWITLSLAILTIVSLIVWAVYSRTLDKLALKKKVTSSVADPVVQSLKEGDKGVAVTRLALGGEAEFDGNRVEVKSIDGFVEEGEPVVIERIFPGSSIYVKRDRTD